MLAMGICWAASKHDHTTWIIFIFYLFTITITITNTTTITTTNRCYVSWLVRMINDIYTVDHILTMMPIFFSASILALPFFSLILLNDRLIILRGDNLSRCFMMVDNVYYVSLL